MKERKQKLLRRRILITDLVVQVVAWYFILIFVLVLLFGEDEQKNMVMDRVIIWVLPPLAIYNFISGFIHLALTKENDRIYKMRMFYVIIAILFLMFLSGGISSIGMLLTLAFPFSGYLMALTPFLFAIVYFKLQYGIMQNNDIFLLNLPNKVIILFLGLLVGCFFDKNTTEDRLYLMDKYQMSKYSISTYQSDTIMLTMSKKELLKNYTKKINWQKDEFMDYIERGYTIYYDVINADTISFVDHFYLENDTLVGYKSTVELKCKNKDVKSKLDNFFTIKLFPFNVVSNAKTDKLLFTEFDTVTVSLDSVRVRIRGTGRLMLKSK